jgi:hypothetical protein
MRKAFSATTRRLKVRRTQENVESRERQFVLSLPRRSEPAPHLIRRRATRSGVERERLLSTPAPAAQTGASCH